MNLDWSSVKHLSQEKKRELLALALEKERALKLKKLSSFRPHSGAWRGAPDDGQEAFLKSKARVRICVGGNQSGKSTGGNVDFVWQMLGTHPYQECEVPARGRIIASLGYKEGASQVIIPLLREWIPENMIEETSNNGTAFESHWKLKNGSCFDILSGEQDDKVFEGWTGDVAWIDEPCRQSIYVATRRGLLRSNGSLTMTMTPLSEPWIFSDLWQPSVSGERDDVACFTIDIMDNCIDNGGYLERRAIEEWSQDFTDDEKEARLHGKFKHLSGRVYPEFEKSTHVIKSFKPPYHWPVYEGIDTHLRKEHAYCQWAIDPNSGDIIACGELYAKMTIPEMAEEILKMRKGLRVVRTLIDWYSETPDSCYRTPARKIFAEYGIQTSLAKKDNGIDAGIHLMKSFLKPSRCNDGSLRPKFFVMEHCRRHIAEFMNYVYDTRDTEYVIKDKPRKTWDDFMDLDRYLLLDNPTGTISREVIRTSNFRYGRKE